MSQELLISLQITVIGMSIVFAALIVLWWLMEILVRLSRDRAADENQAARLDLPGLASEPTNNSEFERRKRAALVAVALAISKSEPPGAEFPISPTASVSPWQAINRANMLNKRGLRS